MVKLLLAFGATVVLFVANILFGQALYESLLRTAGDVLGPVAPSFVEIGGQYVLPLFVAVFLLYVAVSLGRQLGRRDVERGVHAVPAGSLPQMTAFEIAEHLLHRSAWGAKAYARLNDRIFVRTDVPFEMRRMGRSAEVRFRGIPPNSGHVEDIDPGYWIHGRVDDKILWDGTGRWSTVVSPNSIFPPPPLYHHLTAPRVDVLRAWPAASPFLRLASRCWVALKRQWYRVSGWYEMMRARRTSPSGKRSMRSSRMRS